MWKITACLLLCLTWPSAGFTSPRAPGPTYRVLSPSRLWSVVESPRATTYGDVKPTVAPSANDEPQRISWARQWYAINFIQDLPDIPSPFTVLGTRLVVWKDREGHWRVFEDACPHRLAPLSEGRINPATGDLQCAYHGWAFNSGGRCTLIPQAKGPELATAMGSPRACARVYPTRVHQDVLFVMPDASPEGWAAAANTPVPHVSELDDGDFTEKGSTYMRDLPYGYDTLLENLMDPAHVPYTHHGATGASQTPVERENANPIPMTLVRFNETGLKVELADPATVGHSVLEMQSPGMSIYTLDLTEPLKKAPIPYALIRLEAWLHRLLQGKQRGGEPAAPVQPITTLAFYTTPMMPGQTRLLARFPRNFFRFLNPPRFVQHLNSNTFTDGDNAFLHTQEREMRRRPGWDENLDKLFFMPTSSDLSVRLFRKWFKSHGGGEPEWAEGVDPALPPALDRAMVFDRFHSHVKHCKSCQAALRKWRMAKVGMGSLSLVTLALMAAGLPASPSITSSLVATRRVGAAVCVALAAMAGALHILEKRLFQWTDYVHARR